ncbi:DUF4328 domain-containing protein [Altererythrobacter sp. ZODW24]|uniref:DUF4328 domain-containing protein n=1 Tax=Altererythrobacter sp. ZODW24 TaxID=2185142 RepID=UPI000DF82AC9|nr:DUF4328 domain-containing protein [Altererythrobacter sp. ZODW24]
MAELTFEEGLNALDRRAWLAQLSALPVLGCAAASAILVFIEVNGPPTPFFDSLEMGLTEIVVWAYLACLLVSMVFIGMWIHRAHSNLHAIGFGSQEFTPGWAVGWFFVPIAAFWKPFQAMRDLWRRSTGAGVTDDREAPPLMLIWWSAWLIGSLGDFGEYWNNWDAISYLGECVAAICIILIIRLITHAQRNMNVAETFE